MVDFSKDGMMKVAVDAVCFTARGNELQILLIKRKHEPFTGMWAIPGGFVHPKEELEKAAERELKEETGVKNVFLKQLGTYGGVERDPRGRVLSITYIALIQGDQKLNPTTDAMAAEWFSVHELPELAFDHKDIIADALKHLQYELQTTNIAYQILPNKFTLTEVQKLYELVLGKELDKRNFRKKMKELDLVKALNETKMEGAHRPAQLFEFKDKKYKPVSEKVQVFL